MYMFIYHHALLDDDLKGKLCEGKGGKGRGEREKTLSMYIIRLQTSPCFLSPSFLTTLFEFSNLRFTVEFWILCFSEGGHSRMHSQKRKHRGWKSWISGQERLMRNEFLCNFVLHPGVRIRTLNIPLVRLVGS